MNDGEYEDDGRSQSAFETAKAEARTKFSSMKLRELVEHMNIHRQRKEVLEAQLSVVNAAYDVLRLEKVPERMEIDGVENVRYDGIGRVSVTADLYVATSDKAGLFGWLKKAKLGDLIQPQVNPSTLKAFVKKRIKDGKTYPAEFLKVTPITRASITKG